MIINVSFNFLSSLLFSEWTFSAVQRPNLIMSRLYVRLIYFQMDAKYFIFVCPILNASIDFWSSKMHVTSFQGDCR